MPRRPSTRRQRNLRQACAYARRCVPVAGPGDNFYADDIVYYVINNNSGHEGELESALSLEEFLKDILHEEKDGNSVLPENSG